MGAGRAIWRLILFQSILSSCADNVPEPLYKTLLLLLQLKAPCLQHMSTFDKALLFPPTIFSCSGLWNEGANKLAFYVYLCVGVSEGEEREISFSKAPVLNPEVSGRKRETKRWREKGKEERKKGWMFWSHDSFPDCPSCLSCDPPLPQPRQKHGRLDKHYFMQWLDESSDSNYSLPPAPTKLHCTGFFFDTKLQ